MYKQLTSEQRSQIFALLQRKCPRKEIARIVGISQSTLSRELKRNSAPSGKYIWFKAHDKAMERRKRSTRNAAFAPEVVWRIKQLIIEEQWSPRQISGVLKKEGVSVSHQCIYNLIHTNASGELARHTHHKLKHRRRPKYKRFPITERTSIHSRPEQADGKHFGDFEMDLIVDSHNHAILTIVERSTNMLFMTKLAHGKKSEPLANRSEVCCCPTRNTSRPSPQTTVLNLPHTNSLQSIWERSFISQILMPHGRKERLKIQINSSDSIFPNKPTSMISQIKRLRVYRRKSIVDPGKS